MHFLEILGFDLLFSDELVAIPEPDEGQTVFKVKADPQLHVFTNRNTRDAELQSVPRDLAISIHLSFELFRNNSIRHIDNFLAFCYSAHCSSSRRC